MTKHFPIYHNETQMVHDTLKRLGTSSMAWVEMSPQEREELLDALKKERERSIILNL